jgi:hypothetical protein
MHIRDAQGVPMKSKLAFLALVAVCLCGRAQADSTATAGANVDWAGATFSSPVSPGPLANNTYSTIVQAGGVVNYPVLDFNTFLGQSVTSPGWAPTSFTETIAPGNNATASTDASSVRSIATNSGGSYSTFAQAERSGNITTSDGSVVITVPYTISFTAMNDLTGRCCSTLSGQIFIELFNGTNNVQGVGVSQFELSSQPFTQSGTLTLTESGLTPGTYQFDVGTAASSSFVPEPGVLGLVGLGFALIWRRLNNRARMASRI